VKDSQRNGVAPPGIAQLCRDRNQLRQKRSSNQLTSAETMTQDGGEYSEIYLEAEITPKTQTTET